MKYQLSINNFDKENYLPFGDGNIYLHKGIRSDTPICRYIPVDYLIDLLSNKKLYVSNRINLNDKREQGIKENPKYQFPLSIVYRSKKRTQQEAEHTWQKHQAAFSTCVSCWTKRKEESIMLWTCYGTQSCRISTSIDRLIKAITLPPEYMVVIAPVKYDDNEFQSGCDDWIFKKYKAYEDEQEIRLCVLSNEHHVLLDIDTELLIEGIMLNPFFTKSNRQFISDSIVRKFSFLEGKIQNSHLLEKVK